MNKNIKLAPINGKIWIKPESNYEKTNDGWKAAKDSKLVIPESVATKKDKTFQVGIVMAACEYAGYDSVGQVRTATFKEGDRVVYIGAHVSVLTYKDEYYHLIPGEFVWAFVNGEAK